MKVDIFSHIFPPHYWQRAKDYCPPNMSIDRALWDLDERFRVMDRYDEYVQVLAFSTPPVEAVLDPPEAAGLARAGNDELAELVACYPDRFVAGVACLPMGDVSAAMQEADRAINQLGLKGVQVYSNINGRPLDDPEFEPLFAQMAEYDAPVWIHPRRDATVPDYATEDRSRFKLYGSLGWPYETQLAMARLVCAGVLEKHPDLKLITHHCGGGIPFLGKRLADWLHPFMDGASGGEGRAFSKEPLEYLRMFYGDTANIGGKAVIECGHAFFGTDHLLFGTDMPFGRAVIEEAISAVEDLDVPEPAKRQIFEGNARRLLHLDGA